MDYLSIQFSNYSFTNIHFDLRSVVIQPETFSSQNAANGVPRDIFLDLLQPDIDAIQTWLIKIESTFETNEFVVVNNIGHKSKW